MASVYILHSEIINKFYIGSCDDLAVRLKQHVDKDFEICFMATVNDWLLFLSIDNLDYHQARQIESHIKRMKSSIYVRNLKNYPAIAPKIIEKYNR